MFKIDPTPEFTVTVALPLPTDGDPPSLTVRYRALPTDELRAFDTRTEQGTTDLLKSVVVRVDDLVDDEDKPVAWTSAVRDQLLGFAWVRQPLVAGYFDTLAKSRLGN